MKTARYCITLLCMASVFFARASQTVIVQTPKVATYEQTVCEMLYKIIKGTLTERRLEKYCARYSDAINGTTPTGQTGLILAVFCKQQAMIELLLSCGADLNIQNKIGWTALMYAAKNGDKKNVMLLLEHGADPYITSYHAKIIDDQLHSEKETPEAAKAPWLQGDLAALAQTLAEQTFFTINEKLFNDPDIKKHVQKKSMCLYDPCS